MAMTDRAEFTRLILQIERDLLSQAQLRTLLTAAGAAVADHRRELRRIEARLTRGRPATGMRVRR
jgi:hypothetical protein